jgi:hypothetical protein
MWWDRITHVFTHARRNSILLDLGVEERAYRWSTPSERDAVRHDVLCRLEWVEAPTREAAIAQLSQQLDVELPASPPPAFAPMTWDEVRRTARHGATHGPHTVTHPILSLTTTEACRWEIEESDRRLRQETDACLPVFCYPNGEARSFGQREIEAVQRAGLSATLSTVPGYVTSPRGRPEGVPRPFTLPRFPYPDDRPHVVHIVAGLVRVKQKIQGRVRPGSSGVRHALAPST